ncbi:MAG: calcium-binding protein [Pseudomonadota bacterium]
MLWIAGLMGLMAAGVVMSFDQSENFSEDEEHQKEPSNIDISTGTDFDDVLSGGAGDDRIGAGFGDDYIDGGPGNDEALGGDGADTLQGDIGDDTLYGEAGADMLVGGPGADQLTGQSDNDTLHGSAGDDQLRGSAGNDHLYGGPGNDELSGGLDHDHLDGGLGRDLLFGGWGDDTLSGTAETEGRFSYRADGDEVDFLNGGGGDDLIIAGAGDTVTAGSGADHIILGDWITAEKPVHILDFKPDEDTLLYVWDDREADDAPPDMNVRADAEQPDQKQLVINEIPVAQIAGYSPVDEDDITLLPLTVALASELLLDPKETGRRNSLCQSL